MNELPSLFAFLLRALREDRWTTPLRQIVNILGPSQAGCGQCCEGCAAEMHEALRIAKEALGVR